MNVNAGIQEMPGRGKATVPATAPALFTLPFNFGFIISLVTIAGVAVFPGIRRREI